MRHKKLIIGGLILCLAVAGLIYGAMNFFKVDQYGVAEIQALGSEIYDQDVQLQGHVLANSSAYDAETEQSTFILYDTEAEDQTLTVVYSGSLPDALRDNGGVTAHGKLTADNVFHATKLVVSCPSKYESRA
jgi:cytochrome c-type biogenesis protein CcmE